MDLRTSTQFKCLYCLPTVPKSALGVNDGPVQMDERVLMILLASHPRDITNPKASSGALFCLLVCLQCTNHHVHWAPPSTQHTCTHAATDVLPGSQDRLSVFYNYINHRSKELPSPEAYQGKGLHLSPSLSRSPPTYHPVPDLTPEGPHVLLIQPFACTSSSRNTMTFAYL